MNSLPLATATYGQRSDFASNIVRQAQDKSFNIASSRDEHAETKGN
jgi:hypothetical protein